MTDQNRERPEALEGITYKLTWVGEVEDENYYVTVNHKEIKGKLCPYELFFNSQNVFHYPWMVALARMISAVFQRGENVAFVAHELQEVFDPRGGQYIGDTKYRSLLAAVGTVIENRMVAIGYIEGKDSPEIKEAIGNFGKATVEIDAAVAETIEAHIREHKEKEKTPPIVSAVGKAALAVEKASPTEVDEENWDVRI